MKMNKMFKNHKWTKWNIIKLSVWDPFREMKELLDRYGRSVMVF